MIRRKMIRVVESVAAICLLTAAAQAQSAPRTVYAESFRQGATRITEESVEAKLDPQNRTYRDRIKDSHGTDRYILTVTSQGPEGDNKITSWHVKLADLHHSIYANILLASQEPSADAKNNLWWLNPDQFAPVPIRARRIMKVDSFYVVIQVGDYHFTPLDSPYLDSMSVTFSFSNSDPRTAAP
jgi:hypothetical protein